METLPIGTYFIIGQTEGFITDYADGWAAYTTYCDGCKSDINQFLFHCGVQIGSVIIPQGRFEIWETYCECGAHKCDTRHSDWCPAYKGYNK